MSDSVYKIIELVGVSPDSWDQAAKNAVERANKTVRDLRVAEVVSQDIMMVEGKFKAFRTKISVSFKYED
jgi:flavin-binding protein dodecin